jgi:hypothetical protein
MKYVIHVAVVLGLLAVVAGIGSLFGLSDFVRASIAHGHLPDWIMGTLCLIWLMIVLKVPWDLYFQALEVTFEQQRAQELAIPTVAGRTEYIRLLRLRLGLLAIGAHLLSALLLAIITYFTHGAVGYYFAVFYLLSTIFRPAIAGYVYLSHKLQAIGAEARYPREDVVELRIRVKEQEVRLDGLVAQVRVQSEHLQRETSKREFETQELRQNVHAIGREFEASISRLTDNQEVIKGIQAFVRLVTQSTQPPS